MAAKKQKKRNKKYQGADARITTPQVTRVSAEERSRFREWWLTYGKLAKALGVVAGILFVLVLLIVGLVGIFI